MRVAILMRKADAEGSAMPGRGLRFIAKNVRANVRELEAPARRCWPRTLRAQGDQHRPGPPGAQGPAVVQNRQVGVENIQKTVADFYKIKVADMYSKKRRRASSRPRQIAMYLSGDDAEEPARDRRPLRRARPHDHAPRRAQDRGRAAAKNKRAQPAAARARADPERMNASVAPDHACRRCQGQLWGQLSGILGACPQPQARTESRSRAAPGLPRLLPMVYRDLSA